MSKTNVVEFVVRPPLILKVDGADYQVTFPVSSVILAEEKIGRGLRDAIDWLKITAKDLPGILEAGLFGKYPEESAEVTKRICEILGPEEIGTVINALITLNWPKWLAEYEKRKAELEKSVMEGKQLPNA